MAIELITQRTRAEAAEAELREAHKLIEAMEDTAEIVAKQRADVEAGLAGLRRRHDEAYRIMMRLRADCAMDCDRTKIGSYVLDALKALTVEAKEADRE
jgi:hypothetical protein